MKRFFLLLFLLVTSVTVHAGRNASIAYPSFKVPDIQDKHSSSLTVTSVELTEEKTVISFELTPHKKRKKTNCWIDPNSFLMIEINGMPRYVKLISAEGIPIHPEELTVKSSETICFQLTYAPVPQETELLNIMMNIPDNWILSDIDLRHSNVPNAQSIGSFNYDDIVRTPTFQGRPLNTISAYVLRVLPYPEECRRNGIEGTVLFKLKIDREGLPHPEVIEGCHYLLNAAAFKCVSELKGLTPFTIFGKPFNYYAYFPITFKLNESKQQ